MIENFQKQLANVPHKPGVYLFKGKDSEVLYIGKARDLKNRVSQYFHKEYDGRRQIPFLMHDVQSFETIITDNELECLFLENTLIKKHKPRYNIKLRDDKNYAFIKIDYDCEIPQIYIVRQPDSRNARYFGPYSSALKIRDTLHLARKIFPYCANKKVGSRPCFYYYLHRCPGVCIGKISLEEYKDTIKKINLFLAGNILEVKREIKLAMQDAAKTRIFEKAARLRDELRALEIIDERQKTIFAQRVSWDFVSLFQTADKTAVNVFLIRNGKLNDRKNFILEDTANKSCEDIMGAFLENYYLESSDLPKEIFVQYMPQDAELLSKIGLRAGGPKRKLKITKPTRGKKAGLVKLGGQNAQEFFENWAMAQASEISKTTLALDELSKVLGLKRIPSRIECFDISNIQGTNSVASMVVFEDARPKKSDYRKFKINIDGKPDDFAMMREALSRRFGVKHTSETEQGWPLPDLLVVDGGKGQLGVAEEVLAERGISIPLISLAKREEEIFVPGKADPIVLPKSNYALHLLQRVRDEAHRFAITFHKSLRSKQSYKSALDSVPGIGPKKKKLLMAKFGSVKKIKAASSEELTALVGEASARQIIEKL